MAGPIPAFLLEPPPTPIVRRRGSWSPRVLDRGITLLTRMIQDTYIQWDTAGRKGLLPRLSPAMKVIAWFLALLIVSTLSSPLAQFMVAVVSFLLSLASRVRLRDFYPRVLAISLLFGLLVPLPSLLFRPDGVQLQKGFLMIGLLFARSFNSLTLTFLLLWTTPFPEFLRGLKSLRIPEPMLWVLSLTRQYLFLFARIVQDMHLARKSRQITWVGAGEIRGWEAQRIADLWRMIRKRCDDVVCAMRSRTILFDHSSREAGR